MSVTPAQGHAADNRQTPVLALSSGTDPLAQASWPQLEELLPHFVQTQRWYRSKAKTIKSVAVEDVLPLSGGSVMVVRMDYDDGESETYLLPLALSAEPVDSNDTLAVIRTPEGSDRFLYSALSNPEFRTSLLDAIGCDSVFPGVAGELVTSRTNAFDRQCQQWVPELETRVSRAEQSNSSIIYGDSYILKVFRKLEAGINPDIEIGKFLTEAGFASTPQVLGEVLYRTSAGDSFYAGILQSFVPNEGDAWKYTTEALADFFARALAQGDAPQLNSYHPFPLLDTELPAPDLMGDYRESARLLGTRTAEMHAALASSTANPDFRPEPFDSDYARVIEGEMQHEADRAFHLLRDKSASLSGEAAQDARTLLAQETAIRSRLSSLTETSLTAQRIRHHGDYHLGQVLYTGDDFIIIDFEGEPARPLAARRLKTLGMRDVAGMIRSFSYAAYSALFGQVQGVPTEPERRAQVEGWAAWWSACASKEFLAAYLATAHGAFASTDRAEQRRLFDAFVLQKALYEVSYELNNRPSWVQIPLRGIVSLIS